MLRHSDQVLKPSEPELSLSVGYPRNTEPLSEIIEKIGGGHWVFLESVEDLVEPSNICASNNDQRNVCRFVKVVGACGGKDPEASPMRDL